MMADGGENTDGMIAYLDASMIVARSVPSDLHHDDAVVMFDALAELDGCNAIVSLLTLMEAAAAIRRKVVTSHLCRSGSEGERAGAEALADRAVGRMAEIVGDMAGRGNLRIMVLEGWSPDLLLLLGKVLGHAGRAVHYAKVKTFRHRMIGTFDWLHFAYAKDAGALVICTADTALADIEGNDDDFGHIRIQMLGGPLIDLLAGIGPASSAGKNRHIAGRRTETAQG